MKNIEQFCFLARWKYSRITLPAWPVWLSCWSSNTITCLFSESRPLNTPIISSGLLNQKPIFCGSGDIARPFSYINSPKTISARSMAPRSILYAGSSVSLAQMYLHQLSSPCSLLIGMWLRAVNPRWGMKAKRILFLRPWEKRNLCTSMVLMVCRYLRCISSRSFHHGLTTSISVSLKSFSYMVTKTIS